MYDITPSATPEMKAAVDRLEDGLRLLGVHIERHYFYSDQPPNDGDLVDPDDLADAAVAEAGPQLLVVDCLLGDLAFSKRVQDPKAAADDHTFKTMTAGMGNPEFDAARDEIRRRIADGEPLFGDD